MTQYRMIKYLNNIVEQDHRLIKRVLKTKLGLQNFESASALISGIEIMHMLHKQQAGPMSPTEDKSVMMAA